MPREFSKFLKMFSYILVVLLQLHYSSQSAGTEESKKWKLVQNWPQYNIFGQISAVSMDTNGNVFVFHRGNRVWDYSTFNSDNIYIHRDIGSIPNETIVVLDPIDGRVKAKVGSDTFFMPHGLTVDYENNVWMTDVALHQVFKYPPLNISHYSALSKPLIILGNAFEPGNDDKHFCKPTDVAVDKLNGDFYVSDGYCNSRIVKFDKSGQRILSLGRNSYSGISPYSMNVPHALAIAVEEHTLFVADREDHRTLAYSTLNGSFKESFQDVRAIYSVAYSSANGKYLFTLSNSSYQSPGVVTVYDLQKKSIQTFAPSRSFSNPHDIAVSSDGRSCYVVELSPTKIWKFKLESSSEERLKFPLEKQEAMKSESSNLVSKIDSEEIDKATHYFLGGTVLAIGIVTFVVFITFLIFIFHMYKKKTGYAQYEMRRLILDDEEEIGINTS